jgi:hypothetical protein
MTRSIGLLCSLVLCFLAAPVSAAETPFLGLGVGLSTGNPFGSLVALDLGNDALLLSSLPASIYVPINVTPNIRIEPLVGFYHASGSHTSNPAGKAGTTNTTDTSATVFSAGVGAFYVFNPAEPLRLYLGPRVQFAYLSSETNDSNSASTTVTTATNSRAGWSISGAFGGEYYPIPRFSFGAEVALGYAGFGHPTRTFNDGTTTVSSSDNPSVSTVSTTGTLFARFYFL